MAGPLKSLEDQLNCSICLDTYTNPKQLQCNHVYCQQCLVRLVVQDWQEQLTLTCPNCSQVIPVPASGVAGLQPAFRVNQLLEIVEKHKKEAKDATASLEKMESASTSPTPHGDICPEHGGKKVKLDCETCEKTICWKCATKGGKNHSHNYEELDEAFERFKEEISSSLKPLEKQLTTIEEALKVFDACHKKISNQRATIETDIRNTIAQLQARLHQTLEVRKTELISQLDQLTQAKLENLAAQRNQIETTQAQLSSHLLLMRENLKTGNQGDALMMKSTTVRQVKELTTAFQPDMLEPSTEADLIFSALADLSAECQNYGKVYAAGRRIQSQYQTSHQPITRGTRSPVEKLGTPILTIGGVEEPKGVAINQRGEVLVTIWSRHCVTVFSSNGERLQSFGTYGSGQGHFHSPCGVAVDREEHILVADSNNHRIQKFTAQGEFLAAVGTKGSGPLQFQSPRGITVSAKNNRVYVADFGNARIQILNSDLTYSIGTFGNEGCGKGQFNNPFHIACDSTGNVYVTDWDNHRIQVFTAEGKFLMMFGRWGKGRGQLNEPYGIAIDSSDRVYVSEWANHRVSVFTSEGQFLTSFGSEGEGLGQFNYPCGLAVDSNGVVYVCDDNNDRIQLF